MAEIRDPAIVYSTCASVEYCHTIVISHFKKDIYRTIYIYGRIHIQARDISLEPPRCNRRAQKCYFMFLNIKNIIE